MINDYVILSAQRTGSSWVMDVLNNIDGSECHGELFLSEPVVTKPVAGCADYDRYVERKHEHASGVRPFSVFSYLDGLYSRDGSVGFRLMYGHLKRYPEILLYAKARRLKVIHLFRENLLDQVISGKLGRQSGRAHDIAGGDRTRDTSVRLDPEVTVAAIIQAERNIRWADRLVSATRLPSIRVAYETLLTQSEGFGAVTEFLSLGPWTGEPESVLVKRQRRPHSESIENYEEIGAALDANGLGRFL